MANNFEVWKQTLTADEVIEVYGARKFCGIICPASKYCQPHSRQIKSLTNECREKFYEWASKKNNKIK